MPYQSHLSNKKYNLENPFSFICSLSTLPVFWELAVKIFMDVSFEFFDRYLRKLISFINLISLFGNEMSGNLS